MTSKNSSAFASQKMRTTSQSFLHGVILLYDIYTVIVASRQTKSRSVRVSLTVNKIQTIMFSSSVKSFFNLILKLGKLRQFLISCGISFQFFDPVNKTGCQQIELLTKGDECRQLDSGIYSALRSLIERNLRNSLEVCYEKIKEIQFGNLLITDEIITKIDYKFRMSFSKWPVVTS